MCLLLIVLVIVMGFTDALRLGIGKRMSVVSSYHPSTAKGPDAMLQERGRRTHLRSNKCELAMSSSVATNDRLSSFISDVALANPPRRLGAMMELISLGTEYRAVDPSEERRGKNPFLIPIAKSTKDGSFLCYIRWPTQKDDMDLQLVKTTEVGISLLSMGTDQYCHRMVAELDYYSSPNAPKAIEILTKSGLPGSSPLYTAGEFLPFLKSGKFPIMTQEDLRLVLDRFLLTKVGAFPDCYERIANNFLEKNNEVSALVTCERAVSIFYGWGHPITFHAVMLDKIGRDKEARDAARAATGMPAWTVAGSKAELEAVTKLAGFTGTAIVGEMHKYRSADPRTDDIGEGMSPLQVTLDQAAHLMDAVALGAIEGGWDACRAELATKYTEGGYPEMSKFILS